MVELLFTFQVLFGVLCHKRKKRWVYTDRTSILSIQEDFILIKKLNVRSFIYKLIPKMKKKTTIPKNLNKIPSGHNLKSNTTQHREYIPLYDNQCISIIIHLSIMLFLIVINLLFVILYRIISFIFLPYTLVQYRLIILSYVILCNDKNYTII